MREIKDIDRLPTAEHIAVIRNGFHVISLSNFEQLSVLERRDAARTAGEQK